MKKTIFYAFVIPFIAIMQINLGFADTPLRGGYKASNLIGQEVKNPEGKDLGKIQELVLAEDGTVGYAVLAFGGFLGLGDKYFAIPWSALQESQNRDHLILPVAQDKLKDAPGFNKNDWPDITDPEWILVVHEFYGVPQQGQQSHDLRKHAHFSAKQGYLVGGEGKTGNSVRYDGSAIWEGPSYAVVDVDPKDNKGMLLGIVRTHGHTYTILMTKFEGKTQFMDGGIATDLVLRHHRTGSASLA